MAEDSDKTLKKESEKSKDTIINDNKSSDDNKSQESKGQSNGIVSNLKKFALAEDITTEKNSEKSNKPDDNIDTTKKQKTPNNKKNKVNIKDTEDHALHFPDILSNDAFNSLKAKKDKLIKIGALLIGGVLIIYGLIMISASVTKVADNVIFGEGASVAAFFILLGILIIVAAFSKRILDKTFLKNIHNELEVAEGKSKTNEANKNQNDNKVKDNKDNIVGEKKG